MSTDPKNWRPGDIVTVGQPGATSEVELWDRAPVTMATRGFCDPWWARREGRWVLVERQRKSRYSVGYTRATDVHDRVLSGLATMAAIPAAGSPSGWRVIDGVRRGQGGVLAVRAALDGVASHQGSGDVVTVGQLPPSDVPPVGSMGPRLPSPEFMRAWRARRTADAVEE